MSTKKPTLALPVLLTLAIVAEILILAYTSPAAQMSGYDQTAGGLSILLMLLLSFRAEARERASSRARRAAAINGER